LNWRQAVKEGRIKVTGADVSVKLKLENGSIYNHAGRLDFVESNVSETTGTFALRATFPNPDRLLLPGAYVRAIVEQGMAENSFAVPQRGVTRNTKGEATGMFVNADGKVEQRVLAVGQNVGNNWLVSSGIKDGDQIIVEGTQLVKPGADVTPIEVTIDNTSGEIKARKQGALEEPSATRFADAAPAKD
jgi:membrane fusion protein (multidrug efflux system)